MTNEEIVKNILIPAFMGATEVPVEHKLQVMFLLGWLSTDPEEVPDSTAMAWQLINSIVNNVPLPDYNQKLH